MSHPDFKYRIGDYLLRLPNEQEEHRAPEQAEIVKSQEEHENEEEESDLNQNLRATEENRQSTVEHEEGQWVGQLMRIEDGRLMVRWADGTQSWMGPHEVYALDLYVHSISFSLFALQVWH